MPINWLVSKTFRCEGRIIKVKEEIGISISTVRNRLSEVIHALGYNVRANAALYSEQRKGTLEQLANGHISSYKAINLLRAKP